MSTTPPDLPPNDGADGTTPGEPEAAVPQSRGSKGWYVAGGIVGLVAAVGGAAAWAASSFFGTGTQPAAALPSTTVAYASIDLDPNGAQKIAAFKLLRKFPGIADRIGSGDDVRERIVDAIADREGCKLGFDTGVKPWLGDRVAVALVGDDPVVVLQVTDDDKATAGLKRLVACAHGHAGFTVDGDWALVAEKTSIAERVDQAARKGSLADDVTFRKWTDAAGAPGIASFYAAPGIGDVAGDLVKGLLGGFAGDLPDALSGTFAGGAPGGAEDPESSAVPSTMPSVSAEDLAAFCGPDMLGDGFTKEDCEQMFGATSDPGSSDPGSSDPGSSSSSYLGGGLGLGCAGAGDSSDVGAQVRKGLAGFTGAAATLRVRGSGFELEQVGGGGADAGPDRPVVVATTLPSDTAAAIGFSLPDGWGQRVVDRIKQICGDDVDPQRLFDPIETLTGLRLPGDLETLLGRSAAVAVGGDFDPESLVNSTDGSDAPIGVKVTGDPAKIKDTLGRLSLPDGLLHAEYDDSGVALSPDSTYAAALAKRGGLGATATFRDLVPNADDARFLLFLDGGRLASAVDSIVGSDGDISENVRHVAGVGASSWSEGGRRHVTVRVTVN